MVRTAEFSQGARVVSRSRWGGGFPDLGFFCQVTGGDFCFFSSLLEQEPETHGAGRRVESQPL